MERVDYQTLLIQDLVNHDKNEELDLSPWYQRRSVWNLPQKAYLINTITSQKPVPTLYIRHIIDLEKGRTIREIVDGQQRIRAILGFVKGEFGARVPGYPKAVRYQALKNHEKEKFMMTGLSIGVLIGSTDPDVIEIFGRINSVAKTLNAQENRNAKFSGAFKQFALEYASQKVNMWRELNIFTANSIARMDEVQFIADLAMNMELGLQDFSQPKLGKYYEKNDESFSGWKRVTASLDRCFDQIASLPVETIRDTAIRRTPLLFSLILALNEKKRHSKKKIESAIYLIDDVMNTDDPASSLASVDSRFREAATSTTQRIRTRTIRHKYILSKL